MITAALTLLRARGPTATGFLDIVAASGAPRGSIYHHFPGGKAELLVAGLDLAGTVVGRQILAQAGQAPTPGQAVRAIAALFIAVPASADLALGCPVAAAAGEGDHQPEAVRAAVARAFAGWIDAVATVLRAAGVPEAASAALARAVVAGLEGGLLVARGLRDRAPYDAIVEVLAGDADRRWGSG